MPSARQPARQPAIVSYDREQRGHHELIDQVSEWSRRYGYSLPHETIEHVLTLLSTDSPSPILSSVPFISKMAWLCEHSAAFLPCDDDGGCAECLAGIAHQLEQYLAGAGREWLNPEISAPAAARHPIRSTTFWDRDIIDPVHLVRQAAERGFEGVELCIDFHPFNPAKLLPAEIDSETRQAIRKAAEKTGIAVDVHAPIVGPYVPTPSPSGGRQSFYNPSECTRLHEETIDLARDIGAEAVVIHLINSTNIDDLEKLTRRAEGTPLRVTIENYCQTGQRQTATWFLDFMDRLYRRLPAKTADENLGITLDVGHLNIEGEDPLTGAVRVGKWCRQHNVFLRLHATNNYGLLLWSPPAHSADVHFNVSGKGINNALIIKALRALGLTFCVVAEQINPLTEEDLSVLESALTSDLPGNYRHIVQRGRERLRKAFSGGLINREIQSEETYQFVAGLQGLNALREYLVYRTIQSKKHLTVDDAQRISREFTRMPDALKSQLTVYIDDLLLPLQTESGILNRNQLDLICQNIDGNIYRGLDNDGLDRTFPDTRTCSHGETLCAQGEMGHEMYVIRAGRAGVYIDGDLIAELQTGEIFGEISLFYSIPRSATVRTEEEDTRIGILSRTGLENILAARDNHLHGVVWRLFHALPDRLRTINDRYKTLIRSLMLLSTDADHAALETLNVIHDEAGTPLHDNAQLPRLALDEALLVCESVQEYKASTTVFSEGESADGIYLVVEGEAEVITFTGDDHCVRLGLVEAGDLFGEMALIDGKARSATVRAKGPAKIAFLSRKGFREFIETRSELAFRLMGLICLLMFRRIVRLDGLYTKAKCRLTDVTST